MLTERDLRELLDFQAQTPVLSVYLNTEPSSGSADAYRLRLRTMLKDIALPDDTAAVERYFSQEYNWSGKSVAVFSCAPLKFWRVFSLAIPVSDRVRVSDHPHVKPLANLLDSFGGYGVVLVDKQGARLFSFHLGELREQEGIVGESIRHTKHGGASSLTGRRGGAAGQKNYNEEVTDRNMKAAAEFAAHFFMENNVRRVLIGGTDDNVSIFRNHLPKLWQSLVIGSFPMGMTASKDEVLERAMLVGKQAEYRREAQLVDAVITNAAKGHSGAVHLEDTLRAVHDGRVHTLVIREGFRSPGYRCQGCGFITSEVSSVCAFCGGVFSTIPDAVELAVWQVMQQGGEVEVLNPEQIEQDFGGIGALLRY